MRRGSVFFTYVILVLTIILTAGCGGGSGGNSGNEGNGSGDITPRGKNISNSSTDSSNPIIAADSEGNVYVTWEETVTGSSKEVNLATSNDSGLTFSTKKGLSKSYCGNPGTTSEDANVAVGDSSSLYLTWVDGWQPSVNTSEVKFFRGKNPSCSTLSKTFNVLGNAYSPRTGLSGNGKIHIVWAEEMGGGQKDISYTHSEDDGVTFLPSNGPENISNTSSDSSEPMIGFDGSLNVDVVWVEGSTGGRSIAFSRSIDSGSSFPYQQTLSDTSTDSYCPVIATSGGEKIYVSYKGGSSIYFTRWQSTTSSFSNPVNISPYSVSPSCPEMAVSSNGLIHVLWSDSGGIWIAISPDGGYSFATPKDISFQMGTSSSPKMVIDGPYSNVVWVEDEIGGGDIYFSGSADNGKNFSSPRNLSNSSSPSLIPSIASDKNSYIYVSWAEGTGEHREIYFARDQGAWSLSPSAKKPLAQILDISGDGKSDVIIGAPLANDVGEVYIFYSNFAQSLLTGSDTSTSRANYTLSEGSAGDQFGYSAAIGSDINGDGFADVIVGAPYADDTAMDNGRVYIYYGDPPSSMNITPDIIIRGSDSNGHLGFAVSPAGDVNGDGFDDIIIGAPDKYQSGRPYAGAAYIFYGGPLIGNKPGYPKNLSVDDADVILMGENSQDKFGSAVSWGGDFNGDGYDDVIIGAPLARIGGNPMGRAYIYYGGPTMNSIVDVKITAEGSFDQLGSSVARGGDIDGDGYGDVIVGAPYADVNTAGDERGRAYIIYGGKSVNTDIDLASPSSSITVLSGLIDKAFLGTSVGYAGDVNNDGYSDVVVGGWYRGMDALFKGRAYVYLGGGSMRDTAEDTTPDVTFTGENQEDRFGTAVAGAGDIDGDGFYDILVGAYLADGSGTDRGRVYLYLGGALPNNSADAIFTGNIDNGWTGYSLYKRDY